MHANGRWDLIRRLKINAMREWFTRQRSDSVAVGSPLVMTKGESKWKDSCEMLAGRTFPTEARKTKLSQINDTEEHIDQCTGQTTEDT